MRPLRLVVLMAACLGSGCALQGLFKHLTPLTREEQLDELVRRIDDYPDTCHNDYTPAVNELIEIGDPAIPRMLDLLADDPRCGFTHIHAMKVIEQICLKKYGF